MNQSLLAAVHAAAHEPAAPAVITSQTEENLMANPTVTGAALSALAGAAAATTGAELRAAFPDLCAAIHAEGLAAGATAERGRVLGIAALADANNGALIAEMQADGKTTPEGAAFRILGAQKQARGEQLQAIADVETATSLVKPAPSSAAAPTVPAKMGAHEMAARARAYQDEQAKLGNRVSVAQAVAFVEASIG
jgi:capsid assembly protease